LRHLVAALVADKLAPKPISDLTSTVMQIIDSVVNKNGDQVYPRKWNTQFLDAPVVGLQKRPCATADQIENAITNSEGSCKIFYGLTAGTGLRIGEPLTGSPTFHTRTATGYEIREHGPAKSQTDHFG
jgi:hypothetical protein